MDDPSQPALDPRRAKDLMHRLLAWYDRQARRLPWRALPGVPADPYRVWVSEIMLQQTTVAAVVPYYDRFMARWPRLEDLAAADLDDVLHAWAGLGYYRRARMLHACARALIEHHGGGWPDDEAGLRRLPGVGAYTAAAIAAIAFGRRTMPVDGNIKRVVARLFAVDPPLPAAEPAIAALAGVLAPAERAGDAAQAMMDLGATVCTPRKPQCLICPWRGACAAHAAGVAEAYPRRTAKPAKPTRHGVAFWLARGDGAVLLERRPDEGLLGGMTGFPGTPWRSEPWTAAAARGLAPEGTGWCWLPVAVQHTFTHFHLTLDILKGRAADAAGDAGGLWCHPDNLDGLALPTLMRKVARAATGLQES